MQDSSERAVDTASPALPRSARFEGFRLVPAKRLLEHQQRPVQLSDRALDVLIALVERSGEVVSKRQLFDSAWPGTFVEDSNLRVQVAALRRALGDLPSAPRLIASIPGRGYAFVGDVDWEGGAAAAAARQEPPATAAAVPAAPKSLLGRDDFVDALRYELALRRLITITGAGGIGKTAVARTLAAQVASRYADGVLFVDLAQLCGADLLESHLASLMRVPAPTAQALASVVEALQGKNLLIVLDNCEHVVDAACHVVEEILRSCIGVNMLATSREALRASGEFVKRLGPLPVPVQGGSPLTRDEALGYAGVRLFFDRVAAQDVQLPPDDASTALACEICTRLDGLPLAIELAATRVPAFGLAGVAAFLDDRLRMLAGGPRMADTRHRTLRAMIDWSYDWLDEDEMAMLRRLALFRGPFSTEAARAVCAGLPLGDAARSCELIASLVDKSLLGVDLSDGQASYRLFESIRLYATAKLAAAGELQAARQAHARHFLALTREAFVASQTEMPSQDWLREHGAEIADIRAALDWAFSEDGDPALAVRLAVSSSPHWFKLLLVPELHGYLERADATATRIGFSDRQVLIRLHQAQAHAIFHTSGPTQAVGEVLERAMRLAQEEHDVRAQLEVLWALFGNFSSYGDLPRMRGCVQRVRALRDETAHPLAVALHERIATLAHHLCGEQALALQHGRQALAPLAVQDGGGTSAGRRSATLMYDHRTATSSHMARTLWLSGLADQAADLVASTQQTAMLIEQPFALGYFLVFGACPVSIWRGDTAAARRQIELLLDRATGIAFNVWRAGGQLFARVLDVLEAPDLHQAGLRARLLDDDSLAPYQLALLATLDVRLARADAIEAAAGASQPDWATAELLRAKGERLRARGLASQAEHIFVRALSVARSQGALAWELRCACSLARLHAAAGHPAQGLDVLAGVYERFTEGFGTRDMEQARSLLESMRVQSG